jgi:hypothetical protein
MDTTLQSPDGIMRLPRHGLRSCFRLSEKKLRENKCRKEKRALAPMMPQLPKGLAASEIALADIW